MQKANVLQESHSLSTFLVHFACFFFIFNSLAFLPLQTKHIEFNILLHYLISRFCMFLMSLVVFIIEGNCEKSRKKYLNKKVYPNFSSRV